VKVKDLRTGVQTLMAHPEVAAKLTALFST
jgi:hypothetical protein